MNDDLEQKPLFPPRLATSSPFSLIILSLIVLALSSLVGSRLLWGITPEFQIYEIKGLVADISLRDLCDPNPLAGLEGPVDGVASRRSTSLLYALPTKLLRPHIDPLTVHRAMACLFYVSILCLLAVLGVLLKLSFSLIAFLVIYYGLSEKLLLSFFIHQLTLSGIAWFCWTLLLFSMLQRSRTDGSRWSYLLLSLIPITAAVSYETYAVTRPLAIVFLLFGFVWIAAAKCNYKTRTLSYSVYLISSFVACFILKLAHPLLRFDHTLFNARGETIVDPLSGRLHELPVSIIADRILELRTLFTWPLHSKIGSWWPPLSTTGWLEICLALIGLQLLFFLLTITVENRKADTYRKTAKRSLAISVCTMGLMIFSAVSTPSTPAFLTTLLPFFVLVAVMAGFLESVFAERICGETSCLSNKGTQDTWSNYFPIHDMWFAALLFIFGITSLAIPLASTNPLRAHRLFGLYIVTLIMTLWLAEILFRRRIKLVRQVMLILVWTSTTATLVHRIPLILEWKPARPTASHELQQLMVQLSEADLPARKNQKTRVYICDPHQSLTRLPFTPMRLTWKAALYVSDFACKMNARQWILPNKRRQCRCKAPRKAHNSNAYCLRRYRRHGEGRIRIRRIQRFRTRYTRKRWSSPKYTLRSF